MAQQTVYPLEKGKWTRDQQERWLFENLKPGECLLFAWVCRECGSPLVEHSAWVTTNTNQDTGGEGPVSHYWCPTCQEEDKRVDQIWEAWGFTKEASQRPHTQARFTVAVPLEPCPACAEPMAAGDVDQCSKCHAANVTTFESIARQEIAHYEEKIRPLRDSDEEEYDRTYTEWLEALHHCLRAHMDEQGEPFEGQPVPLCADCRGFLGGAHGWPDFPWRFAGPDEKCGASDHHDLQERTPENIGNGPNLYPEADEPQSLKKDPDAPGTVRLADVASFLRDMHDGDDAGSGRTFREAAEAVEDADAKIRAGLALADDTAEQRDDASGTLKQIRWALRERKRHADNACEPVALNETDVDLIVDMIGEALGERVNPGKGRERLLAALERIESDVACPSVPGLLSEAEALNEARSLLADCREIARAAIAHNVAADLGEIPRALPGVQDSPRQASYRMSVPFNLCLTIQASSEAEAQAMALEAAGDSDETSVPGDGDRRLYMQGGLSPKDASVEDVG